MPHAASSTLLPMDNNPLFELDPSVQDSSSSSTTDVDDPVLIACPLNFFLI
jgi:hypothetical protein